MACLTETKAASTTLSYVKQDSTCPTKFIVKKSEDSTACCRVDLQGGVTWKGKIYPIFTGTCGYFTSTQRICPCACAAASRGTEYEIDDPKFVHPRWLVWNHPLWQEALDSACLEDYTESPFYRTVSTDQIAAETTTTSGDKLLIRRLDSEMYEKIGDLSHLDTIGKRITKFRQYATEFEKVACETARGFKLAIAEMVSSTN